MAKVAYRKGQSRQLACTVLEEKMKDDVSDIAAFYNSAPDREHDRLVEYQLEYDLTWRYLNRYLPARGSVLEIGAATGRYTVELARRGYEVTAVDLSSELLEKCNETLQAKGLEKNVQLLVADARDLSNVNKQDFDAVLLMGPLYHLIEEADRSLALSEAFNRLCKGGILISAFISRFGVLSHLLKNDPSWIQDQVHVRSMLQQGKRPDDYPREGFRGYLACVSELAPLHEAIGFGTLAVAGVEPVIAANDESYNQLGGQVREQWLDLLFEVSTEPSIIGASRHLLYVGKKVDDDTLWRQSAE